MTSAQAKGLYARRTGRVRKLQAALREKGERIADLEAELAAEKAYRQCDEGCDGPPVYCWVCMQSQEARAGKAEALLRNASTQIKLMRDGNDELKAEVERLKAQHVRNYPDCNHCYHLWRGGCESGLDRESTGDTPAQAAANPAAPRCRACGQTENHFPGCPAAARKEA